MTEKSLLLKCDFAGRYFIVGTDFPTARIFDTTTSSLAAVVELPLRSRTFSLAALTLTSLAIRQAEEAAVPATSRNGSALAGHRSEALLISKVATYYAAVGLSDGTVILHDVHRDAQLAHVQVSETRQPIISLQICGGYAFCLAANHILYVAHIQNAAAGPCLRLRVQPDASSIAVTTIITPTDTAAGRTTSTAESATVAYRVFRVFVSGPTNALYEMRALANTISSSSCSGGMAGSATANTADVPQVNMTKLLAFPSQGTSAEFAWVSNVVPSALSASGGSSDALVSLPAITASAQDGVVRVWDVQYTPPSSSAAASLLTTGLDSATASSTAGVTRCRRTLLCGQRILNVSVLPDTANGSHKCSYIMVTTLTGSVLLWSLGDALLPPVVEPVPLKPDVVLVSAVAAGRLLFGALRPASGAPSHAATPGSPLRSLEVTLLRGRFALPMFETRNIGDAVDQASSAAAAAPPEPVATTDPATGAKPKAKAAKVNSSNARHTALATLALGVAGTIASAVTVVELPLNSAHASLLASQRDAEYVLQHTTDAATSTFVVLDTVWAAHQQQVAARASQYMTDAFKAPQLYHAKSIQDLPVKQYTLEQRLQQVAREEAAASLRRRQLGTDNVAAAEGANDHDDALEQRQGGTVKVGRSVVSQHALGLATVPLYQALHANDTSAVMDLLSMSARSAKGMRATVLSLQLPYCLQLLHVISERLGLCSKAVEKVTPALQAGAGDSAESTIGSATAGQDSHTTGNLGGSTAADAVAQSADTNKGSGSGAALRGGVAAFSIRSSLLEWIDAIVHYRGSELLTVQRDWDAREASGQTSEATPPMAASPPRDFLAPILHHYESLCSQYDKLAVLYGRLSIFKSVRPSQKNDFTNIPRKSLASNVEMGRPVPDVNGGLASRSGSSKRRLHLIGRSSVIDDDIVFPVMFKESRSRSGLRVVRVRSKLEIEKKRRQRENKGLALQKRARVLAQEQLRSTKAAHSILDDNSDMKRGGGLDDMDQIMMAEVAGKDGEMNLDILEAMDLADDSSDADVSSDSSFDDEEDEEGEDYSEEEGKSPTVARNKSKKTRREAVVTDEMLADAGEESDDHQDKDDDTALDSSEADFSSGSDDAVDSESLDSDDEESDEDDEGSDEGSDEEESPDDDEAQASDEDDGMGEDMQELLTQHEGDEDRSDRRKAKKVRTD
ncbi:conserved hypothetical protein [Leishmania braziliensis MHOM/BR/75/M2904]|uniref:Uncharacterized protein n=2 Tax=Leishmania braziliensis TaxID=5660 RepID=A4HEY5_LEIBR|nr:conserved hypothetical protein [Leishmania braziliensis MHOM/BR/75/M2904]CAJ2474714.1 unnamed protein product [Leishmania braziliensis]CAM39394.2 conserved hypothetical protein [Leishmania braziliensis MHOM/BR/75/M2904]SYZ66791.1 hypothetical_protein [Leishmania braziliensis MHOM/BR/75/M2904]